jgi:hypothetical protein
MTAKEKRLNPRLTDVPKTTDEWQDWHDLVDEAHTTVADHLEQVLGDEPARVPDRMDAPAVRPCDVPAD